MTWNDLGMHCMDEDFAVFAILPPFNTLNAQLIDQNGNRIDGTGGINLYYESAIDPDGSQTYQSFTGTNFWQNANALFGLNLNDDEGLYGNKMPGEQNTPQAMHWNSDHNWWTAEGIPIIPKDSWGDTQAYPLVRVTARASNGSLLAETLVTAPVSAEMNCISCHASGSVEDARPGSGWENDPDSVRDYRMNILALHDRHLDDPTYDTTLYKAALAGKDYPLSGLADSVRLNQKAVLCASCHASNALGTPGFEGVPPLTQAIHSKHAGVTDPITSKLLGDSTNRTSCYQCHPGKETRCLRGAMGRTSDQYGQPLMSCQSCHGGMAEVGSSSRDGWLDEPNCQSCHTGTYTANSDNAPNTNIVRFINALVSTGQLREATDHRFATNPDTPVPGKSLYRYSKGHGDLKCSACHGSPHAIYPTSERNDNLQSLALQGHVGTDLFTYCARDNRTDSNLGIVQIAIGSGANTADTDNDGIADLVERAFGLSTSRLSRGNAPDYKIYQDGNGQKFIQAVYSPRLIPADLNLVFEASGNLASGSWDANYPQLSTSSNSQGNTVVRLALPPEGANQSFLRCRVERK